MDCSLPGSSVHGIFQAGVLEWDAVAFSAFDYMFQVKNKKNNFVTSKINKWDLIKHREKAMAPHSSTVAQKNPMDGGAW